MIAEHWIPRCWVFTPAAVFQCLAITDVIYVDDADLIPRSYLQGLLRRENLCCLFVGHSQRKEARKNDSDYWVFVRELTESFTLSTNLAKTWQELGIFGPVFSEVASNGNLWPGQCFAIISPAPSKEEMSSQAAELLTMATLDALVSASISQCPILFDSCLYNIPSSHTRS